MKVIILHGNDTVKSYERLSKFIVEAKSRGWRVSDYSLQNIENASLFGEECFYILRDYKQILASSTGKLLDKLEKYSGNLIVYHEGKIPALALKSLKPSKVELFELPQMLWKFLDHITVDGLHNIIKTQAVEYIFAMIAWKFKQNYIRNPNEKNADLIKKLAEIDVKSKTRKADLLLSLDLLLVKRLQ